MTETGQFIYHTAMSAADSLIANALGGEIGGAIILGLGTASDTAHDIMDRGGTVDDALIGGAVSGILEGIFEKISLGQLKAMKLMPVDSVKTVLKNVGKSVLTNASEELITEIANAIFDTIFMGELSTYELTVQGYMSQGKSERDARWLATADILKRVAESAISGALTGILFGIEASAQSYVRSQFAARGEAKLRVQEMPTSKELEAMNASEAEARGAMVLLNFEQFDSGATDNAANSDRQTAQGRPTWKQSEWDAASNYPSYASQQSFLDGYPVPYGTKGSVRPDYYVTGHSVEIKNYNLETASGRRNLSNNIYRQYIRRIEHLPRDTAQSVMIDIRGQSITDDVLDGLYNDLMRKTGNHIEVLFKME